MFSSGFGILIRTMKTERKSQKGGILKMHLLKTGKSEKVEPKTNRHTKPETMILQKVNAAGFMVPIKLCSEYKSLKWSRLDSPPHGRGGLAINK